MAGKRTLIECPGDDSFETCLALLDGYQIFRATRRRYVIETEEMPIEMIDLLREKGALIDGKE